MRRVVTEFTTLVALIGSLSVAVLALQTDFSGAWILDKNRSEGIPPNFDQTLKVKQTTERIEIEASVKGPQGEQTVRDVYVLSGKEVEFDPPVLGGISARKGKRTSTLSSDGKVLEVSEQAPVSGPDGDFTLNAARRWSLSADGKTLTMEITMNGPNGQQRSKRVFAKQ